MECIYDLTPFKFWLLLCPFLLSNLDSDGSLSLSRKILGHAPFSMIFVLLDDYLFVFSFPFFLKRKRS